MFCWNKGFFESGFWQLLVSLFFKVLWKVRIYVEEIKQVLNTIWLGTSSWKYKVINTRTWCGRYTVFMLEYW